MRIAIITGASSGMGQQFAYKFDTEGFDEIWGLALDLEGLEETGSHMNTRFRKFAFDLTDNASIQEYKKALTLEKPDVRWLVNCSGFCKFGSYQEIPLETSVNMINLNVVALVKMTEVTLPFMSNMARVVNIASMAALQSTPFMNVYGASKAFVLSYSRSLYAELMPRMISVTCMCPLWTSTKFLSVANATGSKSVSHISSSYKPEDVVSKAIEDAKRRKIVSFFGSKSWWQRLFVKILPHSLVMKMWLKQQQGNN